MSCFGFLFYFYCNSIHFFSVLRTNALVLEANLISSRSKVAEIVLTIIHCHSCYFVFSLQLLPRWEIYVGNHRTVQLGRHLWKSSCPTTLFNQGHLEPAAQISLQMAFDYLQDGDSTTFPINLCQCSVTCHNEAQPVILKTC